MAENIKLTWRQAWADDPWSQALCGCGSMALLSGIILIATGLENVVMFVLGILAYAIAAASLGSLVLYHMGCLCQDEKLRFKQELYDEKLKLALEAGTPQSPDAIV